MTTRKRWTPEEDKKLMEQYEQSKSNGLAIYDALDFIQYEFEGRTKASLYKRVYTLTNSGSERKYIRKDEQYNSFLDGIQALKTSYDAMVIENNQLKKRVAELEQQQQDYETLVRVIDSARKIVVNEQLGEYEKRTFRMAQNGDLVSI